MNHETAMNRLFEARERNAELEATLQEIARQCEIADDPEHHTLGLVKHMALQVLAEKS